MRQLYVYYENPHVSSRYFDILLKKLKDIFSIHKIEKVQIDDVNKLQIPVHSSYPRVLLTRQQIKTQYHLKDTLEGIGILTNNIALVSYQNELSTTMYLMAHEIGHLMNMPHCRSESCLMGVSKQGNETKYAWRLLSKQRKLSKSLLCEECKAFLYARPVTTDKGG